MRQDPTIQAEREARDREALFGTPNSETGRLGNRLIILASSLGIHPAHDDRLRREMDEIRQKLAEISNTMKLAAE